MVLPALVKAAFEISHRVGIDFSLLIGRSPIDRMYHAMQFQDVFDGEKVVTRRLPKQDIAKMIGASREMVSRVMKDLQLGGYIETRGSTIILRDSILLRE